MQLPQELWIQILCYLFSSIKNDEIKKYFTTINSTSRDFRSTLFNIGVIKIIYSKYCTFISSYLFRFGYVNQLLLSSNWFNPVLNMKNVTLLAKYKHNKSLKVVLKDPRFSYCKTFSQLLRIWLNDYFAPSLCLSYLTMELGMIILYMFIPFNFIKTFYGLFLLQLIVVIYFTLSIWHCNIEKQYYRTKNLYVDLSIYK